MLKLIAAGLTALFVTASPLAYAQAPSGGAASAVDVSASAVRPSEISQNRRSLP
jgi:hypothetical protein